MTILSKCIVFLLSLEPNNSQIWTRSFSVDGFSKFSMQNDGQRKFLTTNGKHNLTLEGMFIHHYWQNGN